LPKKPIEDINDTDSEANIHSFIVRIWIEESVSEAREAIWRGHITPIPNGKRHYFFDVNEIPALIRTHLKAQQ
jgi:hypothetical protein